jgi:integrase
MSEIKKLPGGGYGFVVDVRSPDGKRKQVKRKRPTLDQAREELRRVLADDASSRPTSRKNPTLADFLAQSFLPAIDAHPKLKPSSKSHYRSYAKHLVGGLGDVRLRDLAGDHFTLLYGQLRAQGLSETSVRHVHVTAHRALKDACRWRLLSYNPVDDADAPAQALANPRAWTPEQVARFLDVAAEDRWRALWRVAATTGMRRGELTALRWSDLDGAELVVRRNRVVVEHDVIEGTPKNDRARRIALDPVTLEALKRWRLQQAEERMVIGPYWPGEDYCFTWADGTVVHPDVVSRTFRRLVATAKLPPLSLHNLRHAWATSALRAGVDIKVVSGRLGHSSTRVTHDIYTATVPSMDAAAAEAVAGLYDTGGSS